MKVLNFFIASGIVTSLLSSISSTAIYADDTVSDDYSKYAYIDRNFEKNNENEKNEEKNSSVLKNVLVGFSALLGLGTLGAGTWQVYKRFKKTGPSSPKKGPSSPKNVPTPVIDPFRPPVNGSVILYSFDDDNEGESDKYQILDYNYNSLVYFPTLEDRNEFIERNEFRIYDHIEGYAGEYGLNIRRRNIQGHMLSSDQWNKLYGGCFAPYY